MVPFQVRTNSTHRIGRSARHRVELVGELDMATVPKLDECLSLLDGVIQLDCSALTFVDSIGISCLVRTHQRVEGDGGRLVITGLTRPCQRVIDLMDLGALLHVDS